ncbi:hypothetical protein M1M93_00805 [Thermodesulfovibrionales bacterium]|nr:hypothetical protein [Thermodesulfovibrionales bacterium]MCL0030226.1 hypothetical protein [Thermodesulfovibrionales bacterium]MCL0072325.1 hypothetical protein [Thermodesulfovibrionales bacterium]MCL0074609.1 hypothetical protein [Thermodesulfovibrionales bacterium]MCL0096249.1 hypothetical protein [Thermodesulfovibrionales bacterium]
MTIRREDQLTRILKPLSIAMLIFLVFTLVWLRSSVISLEYNIGALEDKRTELVSDGRILSAERAALLSIARFDNFMVTGLTFPDRANVIYVRKTRGDGTHEPFLALAEGNLCRQYRDLVR